MSQAASVPLAALRSILETGVNGVLRLDPAALERCARLQGKVVRIEVESTGITLDLGFDADGLRIEDRSFVEPDTTIAGTPTALFGMVSGRGPGAIFSGEVRISGDTQTGKRLHRLFDALEIDWEEQLSRVTGDLLARKLSVSVREFAEWRRRSSESLALDVGEYLQHEAELLATRAEVEALMDEIDVLDQDVERLAARVRLMATAD